MLQGPETFYQWSLKKGKSAKKELCSDQKNKEGRLMTQIEQRITKTSTTKAHHPGPGLILQNHDSIHNTNQRKCRLMHSEIQKKQKQIKKSL